MNFPAPAVVGGIFAGIWRSSNKSSSHPNTRGVVPSDETVAPFSSTDFSSTCTPRKSAVVRTHFDCAVATLAMQSRRNSHRWGTDAHRLDKIQILLLSVFIGAPSVAEILLATRTLTGVDRQVAVGHL